MDWLDGSWLEQISADAFVQVQIRTEGSPESLVRSSGHVTVVLDEDTSTLCEGRGGMARVLECDTGRRGLGSCERKWGKGEKVSLILPQ